MTAMLNLVTTMLQTATVAAAPSPAGVPAVPFAAVLDDVAPVTPSVPDDLPMPAEPAAAAPSGDDAADPAVDSSADGAVDEDAPAATTTPAGPTPVLPQLPPALLLPPAAPVPVAAAAPAPVEASAPASTPGVAAAAAVPTSTPTADTEPASAPTEPAAKPAAKPAAEPAPTAFALPAPTPAPTAPPAPAATPVPSPSPSPVVVPEAPQPARAAALGRLRHGPDGVHQLEIALHPADLGSVQVRVTITHGPLDVTVACADPAARDAVSAALPSLHRDLAGLHRVDLAPDRSFADARSDQQPPRDQRDTPDQQPRQARRQPAAPDDEFDRWM